jgi:hypothetical protein
MYCVPRRTAKGRRVIPTGSTAFLLEVQALRAEIERLKLELHDEKGYAADLIEVYRCESENIKALLIRAADALESEFGSPSEPDYGIRGPVHELIAEMRKATE